MTWGKKTTAGWGKKRTTVDKRTIPTDGYLDGGEPYTQDELMARLQDEDDAYADEDEIARMGEA